MFNFKLFRHLSGVFWISTRDGDDARPHAIPKSGNLRRAGKACADDSDPHGVSVSHNRIFLPHSLIQERIKTETSLGRPTSDHSCDRLPPLN
jgi:hypothetical protein